MAIHTRLKKHALWWPRWVCQYGLTRATLLVASVVLVVWGVIFSGLHWVWPEHATSITVSMVFGLLILAFAIYGYQIEKERWETYGWDWWVGVQKDRARRFTWFLVRLVGLLWLFAWSISVLGYFVLESETAEDKAPPAKVLKDLTQTNTVELKITLASGEVIAVPPHATWSTQGVEVVKEKPKMLTPWTSTEKALLWVYFVGGGLLALASMKRFTKALWDFFKQTQREMRIQVAKREQIIREKHQAEVEAERLKARHAGCLVDNQGDSQTAL
jgi:hypothetical protein